MSAQTEAYKNEALRLYRDYGGHRPGCTFSHSLSGGPESEYCSCGWAAAAQRIRELSALVAAAERPAKLKTDSRAAAPEAYDGDVCRCGTDAGMELDGTAWICTICRGHVCYDGELDLSRIQRPATAEEGRERLLEAALRNVLHRVDEWAPRSQFIRTGEGGSEYARTDLGAAMLEAERLLRITPTPAVDMEAVARFLFDRLDDIDTADDMAKDDNQAYRRLVRRAHARRFEVATTDGYTVTFRTPSASQEEG